MNKSSERCDDEVAIFLATYNGEKYLKEQLASIKSQDHTNWTLHITDDGSTDKTLDIIAEFSKSVTQTVKVYEGPRKGFAQNFLNLVRNTDITASFFAFCDQDDIWKQDKISYALDCVRSHREKKATVFFSRTELINEVNECIGFSPLFNKKPSLNNALIQSIGGGNTMLFNSETRQLIAKIPLEMKVISHDWITYQIVEACGGTVIYSEKPTILYRQHESNIIGSNKGLRNLILRFKIMLSGSMSEWNEANLKILELYQSHLTENSKSIICNFIKMRESSLSRRIYYALKMKLYRQTLLGEIGLYLAIFLNKL